MNMHKLRSIYKGWKNLLFGSPPEQKELFENRVSVCLECEHNILGICSMCGCPIHTKTKSLTETCPDNRWSPSIYDKQGELVIIVAEIPPLLRELFLQSEFSDGEEFISNQKWEQFLAQLA